MDTKKLEEQLLNLKKRTFPASDYIDESCVRIYGNDDIIPFRKQLNSALTSLDIKEVSYRTVSHWESKELFEVERGEEGGGWRRFSILDWIWIQIITELRKFNFPLDTIVKIKEQMMHEPLLFSDNSIPSKYRLLEFHTLLFLLSKEHVYLLAFEDGQAEIIVERDLKNLQLYRIECGTHLRIPLHTIIQRIWADKNLQPKSTVSYRLSHQEEKLLNIIRTEPCELIEVKMADGKMKLIEYTQNAPLEVHEVMKQADYATITTITEKGRPVSVKRKVKVKP